MKKRFVSTLLALCLLLAMLPVSAFAFSFTYKSVSNSSDFKRLCQQYPESTSDVMITFQCASPIVISNDLSWNFWLKETSFEGMSDVTFIIEKGATLTVNEGFDAKEIIVNGTLVNESAVYTDSLTVNGTVKNNGYIGVRNLTVNGTVKNYESISGIDGMTVSGLDKIKENGTVSLNYAVSNMEELKHTEKSLNTIDNGKIQFTVNIEFGNSEFVVDEDIHIPAGGSVSLFGDWEDKEDRLVVAEGCTLTLDSRLSTYQVPILVKGNLINNSGMELDYGNGGTLTIGDTGSCGGSGTILIESIWDEENEDMFPVETVFPGLDLSRFYVKTITSMWYSSNKYELHPVENHAHQWVQVGYESGTCLEPGAITRECDICGETTSEEIKQHDFYEDVCQVCGVTKERPRIAGGNRFETAFLTADAMKANLGIEKFDAVVVASGTEFADALAGSYLAAVKNAPILLAYSTDTINDGVKDYIRANLNPGGTVYILGGEKAVPDNFKDGLEETFAVQRLAGGNRFETNLLVLKEAGVGDKPILVATGLEFADSLSASATKLPILLVYGDKLLPAQEAFLSENPGHDFYIIGGEGAVSSKLEAVLNGCGNVERMAGGNRFETSVLIAKTFFENPESTVLAYAWDFPDGLCGGPLATTMGAPLILTMEKYDDEAYSYIYMNPVSNITVLGGEKLLPSSMVQFM